ncbi:MAG: hypothetical protein H6709_22460 [Kofleriaceae bacterium]|nr:hypothetical protein [Myxococcales bacterium]MCB9574845.1 hypothetical protein [Kofleriaceae bacterium]
MTAPAITARRSWLALGAIGAATLGGLAACGKPATHRRTSSYANFDCKDRSVLYFVVGSLAAQEAGVSIDCAEAGPRVTRYTLSDDGTRVEDSQELTPGDFDALWKRIDGTGWRNLRDCDAPAGDNEPVYTYEVADWNGRTTFQCDGLHQPFPYSAIVDELDARAAKIRGDRGRNTLDIDDSDLDDDRR